MKRVFISSTMLLILVWAAVINTAAVSTTAAPVQVFDQIPVVGQLANGGTFNGVLDIVRFAVQGTGQNRQLVAIGTLSGTLTNALGQVIGTVTDVLVTLPVAATGTCEILNLTLGPLDLNLLGLMVHLDTVHLEITAQQGPGNLLGNLLCAVAGLLDNPTGGLLGGLAALLNQILGILG